MSFMKVLEAYIQASKKFLNEQKEKYFIDELLILWKSLNKREWNFFILIRDLYYFWFVLRTKTHP